MELLFRNEWRELRQSQSAISTTSHQSGSVLIFESRGSEIVQDPIDLTPRILPPHTLYEHRSILFDEKSTTPAQIAAEYRVVRKAARLAARELQRTRVMVADELCEEYRRKSWYLSQRGRWIKLVRMVTRPRIYIHRLRIGTKTVTRRKLLWKSTHQRVITWYTWKAIMHRHRPPTWRKVRMTKVITYQRKHWRIWQEVHPVYFGRTHEIIGWKTYKKVYRDLHTWTENRFSWRVYRLLIKQLPDAIENDDRVKSARSRLEDLRLRRKELYRTVLASRATISHTMLHSDTSSLGVLRKGMLRFNPSISYSETGGIAYRVSCGSHHMTTLGNWLNPQGMLVHEWIPGTSYDVTHRNFQSLILTNCQDDPAFFPETVAFLSSESPIRNRAHGSHAGERFADRLLQRAAHALAAGDISDVDNGVDTCEGFNVYRSIAELKDTEQTVTSARELAQFLRWLTRSARGRALMERTPIPGSAGLFKRAAIGTLVHAAACYCAYRFAIEPTVSDVQTVLGDWSNALFGLNRRLTKLLDRSEDWSISGARLRKVVSEDLSSIPISAYNETVAGATLTCRSGDGAVMASVGTRSYQLARARIDPATAVLDWQFDPDEFRAAIEALYPTMLTPCLVDHTIRYRCMAYAKLSPGELMKLTGETITDVRDAIANIHSRLNLQSTVWELTPLSFIVDWFLSTGQTFRSLQNLINARLRDSVELDANLYGLVDSGTVRYAVRQTVGGAAGLARVVGTGLPSCYQLVDNRGSPLSDVVTGYSRWELQLPSINIRSLSPIYGETCVRTVARAPIRLNGEVAAMDLLPKVKVRLTASKLMSMLAVLAGSLRANPKGS